MNDKKWAELVSLTVTAIVMAILASDAPNSSIFRTIYVAVGVVALMMLAWRAYRGWPANHRVNRQD